MCGINGVLRLSAKAAPIDRAELLRVRDAMATRGPDGAGEWSSPDGLVAFGHRRLAIIDLSPAAAQPMTSGNGRFTIVFNGEIYNYRELREELARDGARFRTQSDTEVILELFRREGSAALGRLRGMFALSVWDARDERLTLARDPHGIKPLYYTVDRSTLRFASQVQALDASGAVPRDTDAAGLVGFLLWGAVPEPLTIRRGVKAVPAGHVIEIHEGRVEAPRKIAVPFLPPESAEAALADSVRAHLVSDVPVGVFLSSGLDSALVAALACRFLPEPPTTLTLAFDSFRGTSADEAPLAAETARALGTRHVEKRLDASDVEALWPLALEAMDQPSIDGFNNFLVSRVAREEGLKVVLSGLGGDELFGSYPSFRDVPRLARWVTRSSAIPGLARLWRHLTRCASRPKLQGIFAYGRELGGAYFLRRGLFLPEELPRILGAERAAAGLASYDAAAEARGLVADEADPWRAVQHLESAHYLRNQLLRDADWAAMAHSVELRVPLVDASLSAQFAACGFEPARSEGKACLVRRLAPELPSALFRRRKTGFGVPALDTFSDERSGIRSRRIALRIVSRLENAGSSERGAAEC